MTSRELVQGKRLVQNLQNIPLSGPMLDEGFCVFAVRVCSEDSVGRRKLVPVKMYYFLEGFSVLEDRILISKERFNKSVHDYYNNSGFQQKQFVNPYRKKFFRELNKENVIELLNKYSEIPLGWRMVRRIKRILKI